jgi:1-acyl-sn-glycerol-3-phosphate acyltransferase
MRRERSDWGTDPGLYDSGLVQQTMRYVRRIIGPGGYFGLDARGLENVPAAPAMIVSNHSGGTTIPDVWGLGLAWYDHFGETRPLHGIVHEIILATDATGSFFSRMGMIRGSRQLALDVLRRWRRDLLVLPGGDLDAWRPHRERYRVRFSGRTGYARTAIRAQVPIVPVAHAGAHETLMVLTDGRRIAQALHFHEIFRADIFPIHLSLPWVLGIGPWPHLPTPVKLRYRFGAPIPAPAWSGESDPPQELVQEHDERVRTAVQGLLDGLREEQR